MTDTPKDHLALKWGSIKAWRFHSPEAHKLLEEYFGEGYSSSILLRDHDTDEQKETLCKLIDIGNFDAVYLDWDGKGVSKEEAKKYVMEYGK